MCSVLSILYLSNVLIIYVSIHILLLPNVFINLIFVICVSIHIIFDNYVSIKNSFVSIHDIFVNYVSTYQKHFCFFHNIFVDYVDLVSVVGSRVGGPLASTISVDKLIPFLILPLSQQFFPII